MPMEIRFLDPLSVIRLERHKGSGCWLFKMSVSRSEIDGSRDGSPTFFEVPLSATKCPPFDESIYSKRLSCISHSPV